MKTIEASEFKTRCLAIMDTVAATGETWIVTKSGKPVAQLRPYSAARCGSPFGLHPTLEIHGDVIAPLQADLWQALE